MYCFHSPNTWEISPERFPSCQRSWNIYSIEINTSLGTTRECKICLELVSMHYILTLYCLAGAKKHINDSPVSPPQSADPTCLLCARSNAIVHWHATGYVIAIWRLWVVIWCIWIAQAHFLRVGDRLKTLGFMPLSYLGLSAPATCQAQPVEWEEGSNHKRDLSGLLPSKPLSLTVTQVGQVEYRQDQQNVNDTSMNIFWKIHVWWSTIFPFVVHLVHCR